jgi:hypothetical protein
MKRVSLDNFSKEKNGMKAESLDRFTSNPKND